MIRAAFLGLLSCATLLAGPVLGAQHMTVDKTAPQTQAARLHQEMAQGGKLLVIDVREPGEFAAGHAEGAINIPLETLDHKIRAMKVSRDTNIVTMCEHGGRSSRAAVELRKMGYKTAFYCKLDDWKAKGYKVATGPSRTK